MDQALSRTVRKFMKRQGREFEVSEIQLWLSDLGKVIQLLGLTLLIGAYVVSVIVVGLLQDVCGALNTEPGSGEMPDEG